MNSLILNIPLGFWQDDWRHNFINVLPMGVFAIANFCNRRGHKVHVSNAAAFQSKNTAIDILLNRIDKTAARILGLPLHWHLAGHDVIMMAMFMKEYRPDLKIVLGGLTASVYATELMNVCPPIDAVVVGDGELPFCEYLNAHETCWNEPDLSHLPNLVWRREGVIQENPVSYVCSSEQLSELDFSPEATIFSLAEYSNRMRMVDAVEGASAAISNQPTESKWFFMNIGRGCSYDCVYCGGSKMSYRRYCGRESIAIRSLESVLADFQRCHATGFRRFHIAFDPMFPDKRDYFEELFDLIRGHFGKTLELLFEVYGLPSTTFLKSVAKTFAWAGMIISPSFFDVEIRKRFKGYKFSDEEMEEKIEEISSFRNCNAFIYYGVTSLEEWTDRTIDRRMRYLQSMEDRYGCETSLLPIYAEPGSPWVSFPQQFGIRGFSLDFNDFLGEWQKSCGTWNDRLTGVEAIRHVMNRIQSGRK